MNYTYQILKLGTQDLTGPDGELMPDSIVYVHWKKIATDEVGNTATYLGKSKFSVAEVTSSEFIALDSVTKEHVVGWIEASLSPSDVKMIDNVLAKKLEKNIMKTYTPNWN